MPDCAPFRVRSGRQKAKVDRQDSLWSSPLHSPDGMEICLMRAQVAILNYPTYNPEKFIRMSESELNKFRSRDAFESGTLKFSKNTVIVDISDPECIDLSFVDLPGMSVQPNRDVPS